MKSGQPNFWTALPRDGRWLLVAVVVQTLGGGLTLPFTMIYLHEIRGMDLATSGILMTLIAVVALAVTAPSGHWIDRVGAQRVMVWGVLAGSLGTFALAFVHSAWWAAPCFALIGFNMGVTLPAKNVLASNIVEGELRRKFFAVNFALLNLSLGVGGIVGGLFIDVDRPSTFVAIFIADGVLILSTTVILLGPLRHLGGRRRVAPPEVPTSLTYRQILRSPGMTRLALLAFTGTTIGYGQIESGIPVFAREVSEVSTRVVGLSFALNTWLIVVLQLWLLRRLDGHRRTRALVVLGGVWGAGWLILAASATAPATSIAVWGFVAFLAVFAVGEMIQQPLIPVITNDLAPPELRGKYNAVQTGSFQAGGIAGPVIAGVLLHQDLGLVYVAVMLAGCVLVAGLALSWERTIPSHANGADRSTREMSEESS